MTVVLLAVLVVYALLVAAVAVGQRRFIYFPTRFTEPVALQLARTEGFSPWRDDKGALLGWHFASRGAAAGAVLVVHGNAGCALNRGYFAEPVHAATGLDVYVLEYPGYGSRDGAPSMSSLLAAGEQSFHALPAQGPIYIIGESLGTGVAAHLAKKFPARVRGMALFVPYDRFTSVAQNQMRWLPAGLLLRDRYAPEDWLADYRGPIMFVLAENDTIIPARFGRRLHDAYAGPKRLQVVAGAGHNDVAAQPLAWWKETLRFWQQAP